MWSVDAHRADLDQVKLKLLHSHTELDIRGDNSFSIEALLPDFAVPRSSASSFTVLVQSHRSCTVKSYKNPL